MTLCSSLSRGGPFSDAHADGYEVDGDEEAGQQGLFQRVRADGKPEEAQEVLQRAAEISPNNSLRQRVVGDIAARNKDLATAERAYGRVFERRQGSSLKVLDDYANLSRTMLDNGRIESARRITQDLRRDLRGNKQGELAALVMDSLCAQQEGETARAKQALDKALVMHMELQDEEGSKAFPQKITVDLARACLATGDETNAQEILGRIAAENHENRNMIAHIESAFSKTGKEEAGQALLAKVGREVVEINKLGDMEAAGADREVSLGKLLEAANRIPSLQFLLNASNAVFTQLDQKGWNEELAAQALQCLNKAQAKEALNPKVVAARELGSGVARQTHDDAGQAHRRNLHGGQWERNNEGCSAASRLRVVPPKMNSCSRGSWAL